MRRLVQKYRFSKFRCFLSGLVYASISAIALMLCLTYIYTQGEERVMISLTFAIAITSLLLGLVSMFGENEETREKVAK